MCFNPKFRQGHHFSFFIFRPWTWAIIHGIAKLANTFISHTRTLIYHFKSLFLSFQKIVDIGSTILIKVMAVERCSTTTPAPSFNQWFGDPFVSWQNVQNGILTATESMYNNYSLVLLLEHYRQVWYLLSCFICRQDFFYKSKTRAIWESTTSLLVRALTGLK